MKKNPDQPSRLQWLVTMLLVVASFSLVGTVLADEGEEATVDEAYSDGARRCMTCHKEGRDKEAHEIFMTPMGISDAPNSPFAAGGHDCESCHGPSKAHRKKQKDGTRLSPSITFNGDTPVDVQNEVCQSCHKDNASLFHWSGSMHDEEDVACASCHEVHSARDPVFDSLSQQEACFSCHPRTRAETFSASSHPLRFGKMACSDCHDPHNGNNDFMLKKSTVNETCNTCHAEKRGPFLFEHAPVSEDCSLCHKPHGSNHADLLTQRPPLLCQQCHSPAGHPSVAYTSETAENSFQQRFLLGQSCSNCHAQVHGSNHPSGVTLTR